MRYMPENEDDHEFDSNLKRDIKEKSHPKKTPPRKRATKENETPRKKKISRKTKISNSKKCLL